LAISARKEISAKSRYRAFMESVWRRSQVMYPLLRLECGLTHIAATSGLGLLDIVQWIHVQDYSYLRKRTVQNCTVLSGGQIVNARCAGCRDGGRPL
jgi:hypothetical protein